MTSRKFNDHSSTVSLQIISRVKIKVPIRFALVLGLIVQAMLFGSTASAANSKPNILVIMGDDIGATNISAYSHGLMGYKTPNIDQLAEEGAMFTDYYGEHCCARNSVRLLSSTVRRASAPTSRVSGTWEMLSSRARSITVRMQ
jgi:hypothetical protein